MVRRPAVVAVIALAAVMGGCGSSQGDDADLGDTTTAAVAVGSPPTAPPQTNPTADVGSIGDAVEVAAGAPGDAQVAACGLTRDTLEQAAEAYLVLNGALPMTQSDLLDAQLLREESPWFEVDASGTIVPVAGGPCV
jgi:hypothetical protein